MPFEQLAVGWLLERCGDAAPDISLVSEGARLVEVMVQLEISKGLGVVGLSGKRIGDVSQVPGELAHVLVLVPGLLVLARPQFLLVLPCPPGMQRAVHHSLSPGAA